MDLRSLLRPGGDPYRLAAWMLVVSFVGTSGQMVIALQYADYLWAAGLAACNVYTPLFILAAAWTLWGLFGTRLPAGRGLAIAVALGSLAAQVCMLEWYEWINGPDKYAGKGYLYNLSGVRAPLLWWGLVAAAWWVTQRAAHNACEVARVELAADEVRARTAEARLQALQAQVEPHFLFNTLAHVKWLYRRDSERGRRMLDRLLDYLHAALPRVRQTTTTLEQELQLAQAYLDIQQIRIGGRLAFSIEVPPEIAQVRFPPLMLLTLVENAIKHGIAPQTEGGTIGIVAAASDRTLRIEVRDTGAGLSRSAGSGMGLANVRARLTAIFGAGARLVIEPNVPHGVVAAIEIPR